MFFQTLLSLRIIFGFDRFEVCIKRCLDVDHKFAVIRHAHDHVRPHGFLVVALMHLFLEIAMLDHACKFDESPQCNFAPAAANLGSTQGVDEIVRLLSQ